MTQPEQATDLSSPFGVIDGLDRADFREAAYEIFFTSCRSSPGFGGRSNISYYNPSDESGSGNGPGPGSPSSKKPPGVGMAVTSRVKMALGLKMLRRSPSRRTSSGGSNPLSPSRGGNGSPRHSFATVPSARMKRPMTAAEIMRMQMRVTEQSDNRLRKTLMRTLVGQMGRRAETIILPLELLRHLKPSEFNDCQEYHFWQKRQLKILEAGLLLYPYVPVKKSNPHAMKFRDIIQASETRAIDTSKNSELMKMLCNCVMSLAWRSPDGSPTDVCHWADGYSLNVHIYIALLCSIFDFKDETLILDEVDELLELMKKTWSTLGINRSIHNLCFTWVLFEQYVMTGEVESDLLGASLAMLTEVANDAKKTDREPIYVKMLGSVLIAIKRWTENRLLDYHGNFDRGTVGLMENILPLVFSATKILEEDVPSYVSAAKGNADVTDDSAANRVDQYIRSSMRNAFTKMVEEHNIINGANLEIQEVSEMLVKLIEETEELASKEKEIFSLIFKKWHPIPSGVAAVTLHKCCGTLLKQYLSGTSSLTKRTTNVLQSAGKLEKVLIQMVVEDSIDCEDGGKAIVREMVPYEVDSIIVNLLKQWIQEKLQKGIDLLQRAKETETWNPKSKTDPYANSAVDLIKFAKEAVEHFFEIPVNISESLVHELADGLEQLFRDYITFVASCGSKQSYLPMLPPLTRCSGDSKILKLWKKAACSVGVEHPMQIALEEGSRSSRSSTSRGTQRLYIRLNTLHYFQSQLHILDKSLCLSQKINPQSRFSSRKLGSSYFEHSRSAIQIASHHVSEVAAYRLIFLDSKHVLYGSLYVGDVTNARITTALKTLKQNLTLLCVIVTDSAQPIALKEVMKASFEAYLMVLVAGGCSRTYLRTDHPMIEEDFDQLKRLFCTCGEGLIAEDVVVKEAEVVNGVVALMSESTEQLVEEFSTLVCEFSEAAAGGAGQKLPMPPTTGRWNWSDPNTVLRVLCHRNDKVANSFLKKTFQLARRLG